MAPGAIINMRTYYYSHGTRCHLLNFSRGEIVDGTALRRLYDQGHTGKYVCDFADEAMQDHPKFICVPHLGASTAEAEDNCAAMAAAQAHEIIARLSRDYREIIARCARDAREITARYARDYREIRACARIPFGELPRRILSALMADPAGGGLPGDRYDCQLGQLPDREPRPPGAC